MNTHQQRALLFGIALVVLLSAVLWVRSRMDSCEPETGCKPPDFLMEQARRVNVPALERSIGFDEDERVNSAGFAEGEVAESQEIVPEPPSGTGSLDDVTRKDRLIIRSGNFGVVVEDVGKSVRELNTVATELGGFVVSSSIDTSDGMYEERQHAADGGRLGFATLRIPVEKFAEALERVRALGRVVSESVTGQDVTEEFVDAEARLKNLRASEAQFLEIMKRASKVEDVLQVQQQLERVRGEIEQTQGRIHYLERSAKLATIQVSLSTDEGELPIVDPADRWRPGVIIKEAFRSLLSLFQSLGTILLWIVIFIPVWVPLGLLLWWLRRRQSRSVKKF